MPHEQLLDILKNAKQIQQFERSRIPSACPNDGTPLEEGPNGELHCKFDGWIYPRDYVRPL